MSLMDELKNLPPSSLGGTDKSFIDADTLQDNDGNRYRIQGIDAAEVEKVIDGQYKQGTAGGQATTDIVRGLANEQGFTNVVPQLGPDGQPVRDPFGRIVSDLTNDKGQSFRSELLKAGAFDVNKYTTQQDIAARDIAEAQRSRDKFSGDHTETQFDLAAEAIKKAELEEGAKTLGFKRTALNEQELALAKMMGRGNEFSQHNVQVRHWDRDLNNDATNPFSDSWEQGWTSVGESAFGLANMIGETAGWEGVAQWGEDGVARQQAKMADKANVLLDYKDVDGFGSAFEFLGNNLAMSLPYMIGTVGAAAGGAAVGGVAGGAIAIGAPATIYAGQTWNEMEGEKSAGVALAAGVLQASLDRLGIDMILPKGVGTKKLYEAALQGMIKKGIPAEAAKQSLTTATRRELAGLAGDVQKIAKSQITAKAIGKDLLKRAGTGTLGEAGTEMAQEATAYLAAVQGSDKQFNWEELNQRLVSAAIAGGSLGGALSAAGAPINAGAWADVAYRTSTETQHSRSQGEIYANEEKEKYGRVASIEELAADARARSTQNPGLTMDERADSYKRQQAGKSTADKITEFKLSSLWQGATRNIFTPELQQQSRSARILADMFGGNLQKIFHGSSFENSKHHRVAVYKNMISDPSVYYEKFGVKLKRNKTAVSEKTYATLNAAVNKEGVFDPNLIPKDTANRDSIIQLGKELNSLGDRMYNDQKKHNPELGYINNYLFKYKSINKAAVEKNQRKFTETIKKEYGMNEADAKQITDAIVHNPEVFDVDEAFSVVKGGIVPASHRKRTLGLSEKDSFKDFMENDIFQNASRAAKTAARYTAHRDYIGQNGAVINRLLDDMQAEGVDPATVDKVASQLKDYLDAESGNYKRPQTEVGKKFQSIQRNIMTFTTLSALPLAVVSSVVELGLSSQALRKDQIVGKGGSLEAIGKEGWKMFKNNFESYEKKEATRTKGQDIIKDLGFYEWDVGAATVTGADQTANWSQGLMEKFFKINGLQGYTDTTRAIRASLAGDYMFDKAQTIADWQRTGEPMTREVQEAQEALRNLGIDVDTFTDVGQRAAVGLPLTPEEQTFFDNTMREATFNFVNNAVALPQSANRPLIYQDPRFALFTQFQGFMATFTANHIPKLWGEYVKRGTPAMKYNAFATMATMIMLGFMSQHAKDWIKYEPLGDDDEEKKTGLNPHLETAEYIQRGVRASGLFGTGERALDLFFPIYEQRSRGVGDWAWNQVSGESPAISYVERLAKGAGKVAEGDVESGLYQGLKAAPGFGPFTSINKGLSDLIVPDSWKPKGE